VLGFNYARSWVKSSNESECLTCKEAFKQISAYLDGDLTEELKLILNQHICKCAHCKVVYDTTVKTIELYCDGKLFAMPQVISERLHVVLKRKFQERRPD
jgi:predicted anti-sigma-YlaC factor YlaD